MKTFQFVAGTDIKDAAIHLVANAPARALFAGLPIRARYATTNPADIVKRYSWLCILESIKFQASPEGKRQAAESERRYAASVAFIAALFTSLAALDFSSPLAVLQWVTSACKHLDFRSMKHGSPKYDRAAMVEIFRVNGWEPGANTGPAFDGGDPRNYAGWIVGWWLGNGDLLTAQTAKWHELFANEGSAGDKEPDR